jgi:hypothetical protein
LRSSDFAAFVKMMQAMLEVWTGKGGVCLKTCLFFAISGLKDSQRSKLVEPLRAFHDAKVPFCTGSECL